METSLRMRLDHGLPHTPKLLGFEHDENGKLVINPVTAHIPKLMFYMYLYGYSTQQIADALTEVGKITYRGNAKWSAGTVLQVLRNERYCGDVYTRKTFTPDVITHKAVKNRGERPRSLYYNEHDAIKRRRSFSVAMVILVLALVQLFQDLLELIRDDTDNCGSAAHSPICWISQDQSRV